MATESAHLLNEASDTTAFASKKTKSKKAPPAVYAGWGAREVEPGVFCSSFCPPNNELISVPVNAPNVRTAWDSFQHGLSMAPKRKCLGWRSGDAYAWWTYEDVAERVRQFCAAFKRKTTLHRQQCVGIYAMSSQHWATAALAISARSMCVVPLYDTLGPDSCSYIISQTEMGTIFVDTPIAVERIVDSAKETPSLRTIVCFSDNLSAELVDKAKANSINLLTLNDFLSGIDPNDTDVYDVPKAEDINVVQYTSGTTGYPKGVVITHRAYIANLVGIDYAFETKYHPYFHICKKDRMLLFLPMAHMYGQLVCTWFYFFAGSVGFYGGNVLKIVEDAVLLRPTFLPLVPRIMNRVYGKIKAQVAEAGGLKAKLFWYCYKRKKELLMKGIITRSSVWDMIAFRRIQRLLGGRIKIMTCGSAPISPEVLEFWRVCFGALIGEGYGQSETSVISTLAIDPKGGNVGPPLPCNLVKLVDAAECGYYVKDGKGEICFKGPNIMSGYYRQPDKTAEAIDEDGWLHTGDIGTLDKNGNLGIFDRKKHIFKLSQGEYIAPEKVENVYIMCTHITQVFVDGSSLEPFTVAIVVPEPDMARSWAEANSANPDTVLSNPEFIKHILVEMIKVGKENKLNSLEQVKNIYLTAEGFTPANGLMTPSMKNKRPQLRRFYKSKIDAMYKAGPLVIESTSKGEQR